MTPVQKRLEDFLSTKPAVRSFFDSINQANVRWVMFAGSEVALLLNNRQPTDVDILVANDDFEKVAALAPGWQRTNNGVFPMQTADGDKVDCMATTLTSVLDGVDIEVSPQMVFKSDEGSTVIAVTDLAIKNALSYTVRSTKVYLANPFDTVLVKALSRRGEAQGKFDYPDAKALSDARLIHNGYTKQRLQETGLPPKAETFLLDINVKF